MTGKTHMMISAAAYEGALLLVASSGHPEILTAASVIGGFGVAAVAGLMPDIDAPGSTLTRGGFVPGRHKHLSMKLVAWILGLMFMAVALMLKPFIKHRGGTHTLVAAIVFGGGMMILFSSLGALWIGLAIAIGYLFHIVADMTTISGVDVMEPFSGKNFRFPFFLGYTRTGADKEVKFVRPFCTIVCAVLVVMALASLPALKSASGGPGSVNQQLNDTLGKYSNNADLGKAIK